MKKQLVLLALAALLVFAFSVMRGGSTKAAPSADANISFANDIQPVLESRCGTCHMGEFVNKDLHMDSYGLLMEGSESGPVILPGDADHSLLIQKLVDGEMPKSGPKLTPAQIQMIADWINIGAPNN
jgi:hypothetical protein